MCPKIETLVSQRLPNLPNTSGPQWIKCESLNIVRQFYSCCVCGNVAYIQHGRYTQHQCRKSIHRFHNWLYNHGEGLLLVESANYLGLSHLKHYEDTMLNGH